MQLYIHSIVVTFNWFWPNARKVSGSTLMPSMTRRSMRFHSADWRDFFAIEAK